MIHAEQQSVPDLTERLTRRNRVIAVVNTETPRDQGVDPVALFIGGFSRRIVTFVAE